MPNLHTRPWKLAQVGRDLDNRSPPTLKWLERAGSFLTCQREYCMHLCYRQKDQLVLQKLVWLIQVEVTEGTWARSAIRSTKRYFLWYFFGEKSFQKRDLSIGFVAMMTCSRIFIRMDLISKPEPSLPSAQYQVEGLYYTCKWRTLGLTFSLVWTIS